VSIEREALLLLMGALHEKGLIGGVDLDEIAQNIELGDDEREARDFMALAIRMVPATSAIRMIEPDNLQSELDALKERR
jgi:hypothetical protein